MPRKHRLTRADLASLPQPRRTHGEFLSLSISEGPFTEPRFACVVSKKVSLRAVDRNRVKRRVRASLAPIIPLITEPRAFVLVAKAKSRDATYQEIDQDVRRVIESALRRSL